MFYSISEKMDMLSCFIECGRNKRKAALLYSQRFGLERQVPNSSIFLRLEKNLKSTGSFNKNKNRKRTKTTEEYSQIVLQKLEENPNTSLRIVSSKLTHIHLYVYLIQFNYVLCYFISCVLCLFHKHIDVILQTISHFFVNQS